MNDLVSYERKHNEQNREDNRDGTDDNRSWNCGIEGPGNDPGIEKLRNRQVKNFFTVTLLSLGLPMFPMGDEVRRTQQGNNNAYCQDNETSWFDWSLVDKHAEIHRFVKVLTSRRRHRDTAAERQRMSLTQMLNLATKAWHGVKLNQPDWADYSHSVALTAELKAEHIEAYFLFNAYWEPLEFELPPRPPEMECSWRRWIDTFLESPEDIVPWEQARFLSQRTYRAGPRSVVVLWAKLSSAI
jgi:glycogen operon protein